jgi:hypothetical protein
MRRLRRAHQRHAREQAKRRKKFKQRAVAAGTAAVIILGAGVSLNKALAAYTPDPHELPVAQDADADLLANKEELAIGYRVFKPDQNRNEIPDGVELAKRCATVINQLPWQEQAFPGETYKWCAFQYGLEICDICSATINMGGAGIVNPKLDLSIDCPLIAIHYMEHGSFSYAGHYSGEPLHVGRIDVPALLRALELRYPYEPNEHQLPLYTNDLDDDLLADSEELAAGYNLHDADQDSDLTHDGIELAKQCSRAINDLPIHSEPNEPYKIGYFQRGFERCEICGELVNMGYWQVVNPKLGLSIDVYDIICHYMSHGSFSYSGTDIEPPHEPFHAGRIDISLLLKILEMPRLCGDLGTLYLPGDFNKDCKEDFKDFTEFADKWLESTDPNENGTAE